MCTCVHSRGGAVKDCVLLRKTVLVDDLSRVHSQVHVIMCCVRDVTVLSLFNQCSIFLRVFFSLFFLSLSHQHDFTLAGTLFEHL